MEARNEDAIAFPQSIDHPGAWDGRQFTDENEYVYQLDASEVQEIEDALCQFKTLGLDGDLISRQNFRLPVLRQKLDRIRLEIFNGSGFGLIRGLDPAKYSATDLTLMYLGVQSYIADRRGQQDKDGNMLVHIVADDSSALTSQHHRHSTSEISFHNEEAGDIISWLTRSAAASGGSCIISSAYRVYNLLNISDPDSIRVLTRPDWVFANQEILPRSIFFYHNKKIVVNFGRVPLIGNETHPRPPHLPPMSKEQIKALDEVENIARNVQLKIKTRPGDIHFINNLFVLHRRECFLDDGGSGKRRHLVRMRLGDDAFRHDFPIALEKEWSYSFNGSSTRVWHIEPMPEGFFPLRSYPN